MSYDDRRDFDDGLDGAVPDRIPDWLLAQIKGSKRHNLSEMQGLAEFFNWTDTVKSDRFDQSHFKRMRREAPELESLATSRFIDDPAFFDLVQDEFLGLLKPKPELRKEGELRPTHKVNRSVMDRVSNMREWQQLRTYTELDEWAAAMAAVDFGMKLADILDEMREMREHQKAASDAAREAQKTLDRLKGVTDGDRADQLLDKLKEQLQEMQEAGDSAAKATGDVQFRAQLRAAVKDTLDDANGLDEMMDSFGTEPGSLQRMDGEERMRLARRIVGSKKLKELADKVGRFVRLAIGEQARKISHGFDEIHEITLGNNLPRVLPSELVTLRHPLLRLDFVRRYAENELMQYEMRGTEKVAQGAMVVMIDSSGSMGGGRETWAKAVAIALLHIAHRQHRDFYCIIFGSANQMWESYFPKGVGGPQQVLDMAEFAFMGGTDFMTPISRAVEVLEEQFNSEYAQKGDLVLITDGECAVTPEWHQAYIEAKERLAFRMYGCMIGFNSALVDTLSDVVYDITELAEGRDVREMFGFV